MGCSSSSPRLAEDSDGTSTGQSPTPFPRRMSTGGSLRRGGTLVLGRALASAWKPGEPIPPMLIMSEASDPILINVDGGHGLSMKYGALTRAGHNPQPPFQPNQDNMVLLERFAGHGNLHLFCVIDGHGPKGQLCAHFLAVFFPEILAKSKLLRHNNKEALVDSFHAAHAKLAKHLAKLGKPAFRFSGASMLVLLLLDDVATFASCGDCRAVLGHEELGGGGRIVAKRLTGVHVPDRADERERLIQSHEVDFVTHAGKLRVCKVANGTIRYGYPTTRSLGDITAHQELGLIATPQVHVRRLKVDRDRHLLLATAGLFEVMSEPTAVSMVSAATDPLIACESLMNQVEGHFERRPQQRQMDSTVILLSFEEMGADQPADDRPPTPSSWDRRTREGVLRVHSEEQSDGDGEEKERETVGSGRPLFQPGAVPTLKLPPNAARHRPVRSSPLGVESKTAVLHAPLADAPLPPAARALATAETSSSVRRQAGAAVVKQAQATTTAWGGALAGAVPVSASLSGPTAPTTGLGVRSSSPSPLPPPLPLPSPAPAPAPDVPSQRPGTFIDSLPRSLSWTRRPPDAGPSSSPEPSSGSDDGLNNDDDDDDNDSDAAAVDCAVRTGLGPILPKPPSDPVPLLSPRPAPHHLSPPQAPLASTPVSRPSSSPAFSTTPSPSYTAAAPSAAQSPPITNNDPHPVLHTSVSVSTDRAALVTTPPPTIMSPADHSHNTNGSLMTTTENGGGTDGAGPPDTAAAVNETPASAPQLGRRPLRSRRRTPVQATGTGHGTPSTGKSTAKKSSGSRRTRRRSVRRRTPTPTPAVPVSSPDTIASTSEVVIAQLSKDGEPDVDVDSIRTFFNV